MTFTQWNFQGVRRGSKFTHDSNIEDIDYVAIFQIYYFTNICQHVEKRNIDKNHEVLLTQLKNWRSYKFSDEYVGNFSTTAYGKR